MIDLEEARRLLGGGPTMAANAQAGERVIALALVAELRAAREVVECGRRADHAVDLIGTTEYSKRCRHDLGDAIRAYDQAVTS